MTINLQIIWLFLLSIPVACITWTITHEEIFKELRDYCINRSKTATSFLQRKIYYLFTCEYCFSHYVTAGFLLFTDYKLLLDSWKGYVIAGFSVVWVANIYMNIFAFIRQDIKKVKTEIETIEQEIK